MNKLHHKLTVNYSAYGNMLQINEQQDYFSDFKLNLNSFATVFQFRAPSIQQYFSIVFYYYYIPTTCFGPYGPSSSVLYIYILVNS
jgi:hypothetical protein